MSRKTWGYFPPVWTGRKRGMRPAEIAICPKGHTAYAGSTKRPRCHVCAAQKRVKQSEGPLMATRSLLTTVPIKRPDA